MRLRSSSPDFVLFSSPTLFLSLGHVQQQRSVVDKEGFSLPLLFPPFPGTPLNRLPWKGSSLLFLASLPRRSAVPGKSLHCQRKHKRSIGPCTARLYRNVQVFGRHQTQKEPKTESTRATMFIEFINLVSPLPTSKIGNWRRRPQTNLLASPSPFPWRVPNRILFSKQPRGD